MDSAQRQAIYKRISQEFQITEFKKYYYCFGINYFSLTAKLKKSMVKIQSCIFGLTMSWSSSLVVNLWSSC